MNIVDFEYYKQTGKLSVPKGHPSNDNDAKNVENLKMTRSTSGEYLHLDERGNLWPRESVCLRSCYDM